MPIWPSRRRMIGLGVVALAAALATGLGAAAGQPARAMPVPTTGAVAPRPTVNAAAFHRHGELAFVSRDTLWVLDGTTGSRREVAGGFPTDPMFSVDGKWLAYLTTGSPDYGVSNPSGPGQLWIAHADGSDPRAVRDLAQASDPSWSPTADVLGVVTGLDGGLALVTPSGTWHRVAGASLAARFVWSPDGREVAFAGYYQHGALQTVSTSGGSPVLWQAEHNNAAYPDSFNPDFPARWLPHGEGILYWVDEDDSSSLAADGLPLFLVRAPRAVPNLLAVTLVDPASIATSATGELAITAGSLRYQWTTKAVDRCSTVTDTCAKVPIPPGTVSIDPSWSPGGKQLVFAQGPDNGQSSLGQAQVSSWYSELSLRSIGPEGRAPRALPGTNGGAVSEWSRTGQDLLYEARDGLWLTMPGSGHPVEIARPLFAANDWPNYYAQVDWAAQFAWSAAPCG